MWDVEQVHEIVLNFHLVQILLVSDAHGTNEMKLSYGLADKILSLVLQLPDLSCVSCESRSIALHNLDTAQGRTKIKKRCYMIMRSSERKVRVFI